MSGFFIGRHLWISKYTKSLQRNDSQNLYLTSSSLIVSVLVKFYGAEIKGTLAEA
jgi:hypothetical protein